MDCKLTKSLIGMLCTLMLSVFIVGGHAPAASAAPAMDTGHVSAPLATPSVAAEKFIVLAQKSPDEKKKAKKNKAKKKKANRAKAKSKSKPRNKANKKSKSNAKKAQAKRAQAKKAKAKRAKAKSNNAKTKARKAKAKAQDAKARASKTKNKAAAAERKAKNKAAKARAAKTKADRSNAKAKARAQKKNKPRTKTGAKAAGNKKTGKPTKSQALRDKIDRMKKREARDKKKNRKTRPNLANPRRDLQPDAKRAGAKKAAAKRRAAKRRQSNVNARKFKQLQARQSKLQRRINKDRNRAQRLERQDNRLARQRNWLRNQRAAERRRMNRNFGFRDRARLVDRRRDRVIFSSIAGAVLGAAVVGSYFVYHNDDTRIDWRARDVYVDDLANGWTRNVVIRPNGVRVVTIRDSDGFIVRRYRVYPGNRVVMLFDNQPRWWDNGDLAVNIRPARYTGPRERYIVEPSYADVETVYDTIVADPIDEIDRTYTLNQILVNANLRGYMPRIDLDTITFASGSAVIPENQLDILEEVAAAMAEAIKANPEEVFLIEGYTDATGAATDNLALSDERASSVANALTEYYEIPPENLVAHGYGEEFLKIETDGPESRNRRVAIRRITPLLANESEGIAFDPDGNEVFN